VPEDLTDKQRRFIEEYPKDCNKAAAARRAGYEPAYARQIGYENYTKPYIRAAIDARLKALTISGDEALKHVSDIATTRLNSFLIVRQVQGYREEEQYVTVLLTHARNEIKTIEAFIGRHKLSKEARYPFGRQIVELLQKILDYEK
jgi:hypothetical protein